MRNINMHMIYKGKPVIDYLIADSNSNQILRIIPIAFIFSNRKSAMLNTPDIVIKSEICFLSYQMDICEFRLLINMLTKCPVHTNATEFHAPLACVWRKWQCS